MINDRVSIVITAIEEAFVESSDRIEAAKIYAEMRLGLEQKLIEIMDWFDTQDNLKEKKDER